VCTIKIPTPLSPVIRVDAKPDEKNVAGEVKHFPLLIKLMIDGNAMTQFSDLALGDTTSPNSTAINTSDSQQRNASTTSLSQSRELRREFDALFESASAKQRLQAHFLQQMSKYMRERDYPSLLIEGTKRNWLKRLLSAVPYFPLSVFGTVFLVCVCFVFVRETRLIRQFSDSLEPLFQVIQQLASYHITVPNMKRLFRLLQKRSDTIGNEKVSLEWSFIFFCLIVPF
jgi:hypothetical protein